MQQNEIKTINKLDLMSIKRMGWLFFVAFLLLFSSCTKDEIIYIPKEDTSEEFEDNDDDVFQDPEVVVEIDLPKGNYARFFGSEYSNESNIVRISLSNDLSYGDEYHAFIIELNVPLNHDMSVIPNGRYYAADNMYSFVEYTYGIGYGEVGYYQDGTMYMHKEANSSELSYDLLETGYIDISNSGDEYTITAVVSGRHNNIHYFNFKGNLVVEDYTNWVNEQHTTLRGDFELPAFTQQRLINRGDYYKYGEYGGKVVYSLFEVYLATDGIDLSPTWPSGTGEYLRIEFTVADDLDEANGIPEGTYNVVERFNGGILSSDLIPFNIMSGALVSGNRGGTWYVKQENHADIEYARIDGGKVTVTRNGAEHTLQIEFTDCASRANRVTGTYTFTF